jgi:hypothetical protein
MDFQLIALIALVVTAVFLSARLNSTWLARPGYVYQRVFSNSQEIRFTQVT